MIYMWILWFSFYVETSSKNIGNELRSPLDCVPFSYLYPFPKLTPRFLSMPFAREIFATFLTTSFPSSKKVRRRKKSKQVKDDDLQEIIYSSFPSSHVSLVCFVFFMIYLIFALYFLNVHCCNLFLSRDNESEEQWCMC